MNEPLPEPLVPADVDLRNFTHMGLDVVVLRDSRFAARVSGEAFRAGVMLWCAAWHQVPAASLPDDDIELANLAGYGRAVKQWLKVRDESLSNFVKCSDKRLYHRYIATKAISAWEVKLQHLFERERDRLRKANKARASEGKSPLPEVTFESWNLDRQARGIPPESDVASAGIPAENALKGIEKRGKELSGKSLVSTSLPQENHQPAAAGALPSAEPQQPALDGIEDPAPKFKTPACPHLAILALWEEVLPGMSSHDPQRWRGKRATDLQTRWRETAKADQWPDQAAGITYFRRFFCFIGRSPFLTGKEHAPGRKPFRLTLGWLLKEENWDKAHEANYQPD